MKEIERFDAIGDDGGSYEVVIRQVMRKAANGANVPGLMYAHLSTGHLLEHQRDDVAAFKVVDTDLTVRRKF